MNPWGSDTRQNGFTLMEVLVALVIVSVCILGLARSASNVLDTHYELERSTLGLIVANNALAELKLSTNIGPSRREGQSSMAGRTWYWQALIQPTPDGSMLRVDVGVFDRPDAQTPLVLHTGFLATP